MSDFIEKNQWVVCVAVTGISIIFLLSLVPTHYILTFDCPIDGEKMMIGNIPIHWGTTSIYSVEHKGHEFDLLLYYDGSVWLDGAQIVRPGGKYNGIFANGLILLALGVGIYTTSNLRDVREDGGTMVK